MLDSPLAGKHVVVTRAEHQAEAFCSRLRQTGAQPLAYPCIAIMPPADLAPLDDALRETAGGAFGWLVLTSVNTVLVLEQRLTALGIDAAALQGLKTAAIGPATASAAQKRLGLTASVVPDEYVAEALAEALLPVAGTRILLPRAGAARPVLVEELAAAGASVTVVKAYETAAGSGGVDLPALLATGGVDAITLTSSSTAHFFVQRLLAEGGRLADMAETCVACIGPITAQTAREQGLPVHVTAEKYTLEGLLEALTAYYSGGK